VKASEPNRFCQGKIRRATSGAEELTCLDKASTLNEPPWTNKHAGVLQKEGGREGRFMRRALRRSYVKLQSEGDTLACHRKAATHRP
jgi:hypothetical protein